MGGVLSAGRGPPRSGCLTKAIYALENNRVPMLEVDGSQKSGSGTIARFAVGLATLLGEPLYMWNIRARREKPGLRPQHLAAIEACARLCGGRVESAFVGSSWIRYFPGAAISGGHYRFDIGTAGSTTMFALTLLPVAAFADRETSFEVRGGVAQDFAPSAFHTQNVLLPTLRKMGVQASLSVDKMGYVPRGEGVISVRVQPVEGKIKPLVMLEQGRLRDVGGVAVSSHLERQRVSERMRVACCGTLEARGYSVKIKEVNDHTSVQPGAALAVWASNESCVMGMDRAGKIGRRAEEIGGYVAKNFLRDVGSGATADRFLSDQVVLYCALAEGTSKYRIPAVTPHVDTNLWLAREMLGAQAGVEGNLVEIRGVGHRKRYR